jgi:hypothetical protein
MMGVLQDGKPICMEYPILYELALNQNCSVHDMVGTEWVDQFRIRLPPLVRKQWYHLAARLNRVSLNDEKDKATWKWTPNKDFSVNSVYKHMTRDDNGNAYCKIWKAMDWQGNLYVDGGSKGNPNHRQYDSQGLARKSRLLLLWKIGNGGSLSFFLVLLLR